MSHMEGPVYMNVMNRNNRPRDSHSTSYTKLTPITHKPQLEKFSALESRQATDFYNT